MSKKNLNTIFLFKVFSILIILISFSASEVYSQKERKHIRSGTKTYHKALGDSGYVDTTRMQIAEAHYRDALDKDINSFEGGFNLGASLFKQQKFSDAVDQYKILTSSDVEDDKLAKVYHNLGNSLFMDGKLEESIEAYKSSLRISPADTTTRYNLAAAQKLLEDAKNNPDKQQQEQDQDQDSQNQEKQDQEEQQQQEQEQEQEQQQQEEQEQQQAQEDEKGEEGEEKEAMKPDEISKEDAERLLQAIQQDEKELQEKLKKQKAKAKRIRVEKEW